MASRTQPEPAVAQMHLDKVDACAAAYHAALKAVEETRMGLTLACQRAAKGGVSASLISDHAGVSRRTIRRWIYELVSANRPKHPTRW